MGSFLPNCQVIKRFRKSNDLKGFKKNYLAKEVRRMKFIQKNIFKIAILTGLGLFTFLAEPAVALAQDYPVKPIILNVGFTAGGAAGNSAQVFAEGARKYLPKPQSILVNFKPGAGTAVAADYVLKQPADGYNLFWFATDTCDKLAKDAHLLSFTLEDFIHIGTLAVGPQLLVVNREKSPFTKLEDLIDYAKKHPGGISYGSPGIGSITHVTGEIIMLRCGIKINQIPFAGASPAMTALLGGHIDTLISSAGTLQAQIQPGGGLRALAIMAHERWSELPDVPTFLEKGYDVVRGSWYGVAVAKGTPKKVVDILTDTFQRTARDAQVKANIGRLGYLMLNWSPEETKRQSKEEYEAAREIFRKAGL
jgi:tripartite-type tricarboxylate transporter receptor subunit TctC